jgi:hypothetical protein
MAGVSGPLLRRNRSDGLRLISGLLVGGLAAALLVSLVSYAVGVTLGLLLPLSVRAGLLLTICVALGLADLFNRTPHAWRQVPQRLVHALPPGLRGLTWGFDLGLLVTTQKAVSLGWAAIAAITLLQPSAAPALLVVMAVLSNLAVAWWSTRERDPVGGHGSKGDRVWLRRIRALSAAMIAGTALFTAVTVL